MEQDLVICPVHLAEQGNAEDMGLISLTQRVRPFQFWQLTVLTKTCAKVTSSVED
jgi:hypothetical protein